jgi:hypothetical protein
VCDNSPHTVVFRLAKVGETLVTTGFHGTSTRGFAAKREPNVAVCLLPGTELAFEHDVRYDRNWLSTRSTGSSVARFYALEFGRLASASRRPLVSGRKNGSLESVVGRPARAGASTVIPREQSVDGNAEKTVILAIDPELTA